MESLDKTPEQHPLHTIIEYMIRPLKERIKEENVSEAELTETLKSAGTLLQFITSLEDIQSPSHPKNDYENVLVTVVRDVCFPMIYSLHHLPPSEKRKALSLLTQLILVCCQHLENESLPHVVTQIIIPLCSVTSVNAGLLLALKNDAYHQSTSEPLDKVFSLELFSHLLNNQSFFNRYLTSVAQLNIKKEDLLDQLFQVVIGCAEEESAFSKVFTVTSKLLTHFPTVLQQQCIAQVWQKINRPVSMYNGSADKEFVWRSLYVCYCLKNYFFPLDEKEKDEFSSKVSSNSLWAIVQSGLVSIDPSHRKLAMYLLKRLVDTCNKNSCSLNSIVIGQHSHLSGLESLPLFWWSPRTAGNLSVIWEDYILLIETLEEKQVHIIKPLLSRIQKLIAACMVSENGPPMLHSSWLVTIVTRCFQHDSHYMSRWGAQMLLTLDFEKVPLIQHGQLKFLSHDLVIYLQENKLYSRYEGTELGKSTPVGEALKGFFANLFCTLAKEQKVEFLSNVLRIVCENNWGSIPLTFVFEGLSHIPADPILGGELLKLIRQILQSCLSTHESFTRGATESFICQTVVNLVDLESVNLGDFFSTLAALNRDESLQRDTSLWKTIVNWLDSEAVEKKWKDRDIFVQALDYLQENLNDEGTSIIVDGYKVISVARMLILFSDMMEQKLSVQALQNSEVDVDRTLENSPLGLILAEISEILRDIRSRSYANTSKVDRCLSLLFSLSKETGNFTNRYVDNLLKRSLALHFKDVAFFVKTRLSQAVSMDGDTDEVKFYTDVLLSLGLLSDRSWADLKELVTFVSRAFTLAIQAKPEDEKFVEYDVLSTSAMKMLSVILRILSSNTNDCGRNYEIIQKVCEELPILEVPLPFSRKSSSKERISKGQIGRVVSRFISSKWKCQRFIFEQWLIGKNGSSQSTNGIAVDVNCILNIAMEDLSIGSGNSDVAIFQALEVIMDELVIKMDSVAIVKLLEMSWSKVMEEKKNIRFWKKLKALVPLALCSPVLLQEQDSTIAVGVDEFIEKLVRLGSDKTGVMYLVFDHLCNRILQKDPNRRIATRLIPLLVDGCCIGTMHKRGERVWLDICAYIESLGDSCAVNQITSSIARNDLYTRIIIINWLSCLSPDIPADEKFVLAFLQSLKFKYIALAALTTYKQFANSLSHRQKHRMVLVLLLLVDFIKKSACEEYLSIMWHALEVESHPSVRQMLEWLVMILIGHNPESVFSILDVFRLYDNKRSVCLCSLFLIISHLGLKLPSHMQDKYYSQTLSAVLPWTMAHHYNTRIFAQATLTCLWEQCQVLHLNSVINQNLMVQSVIDFLFNNGNASGTVSKLLNIYMYRPFDPVKDFSMETIFYTLPKLACLADDEWILPTQFVRMDHTWEKGQHLIPLRNSSNQLALCKEGPWRMKAPCDGDEDTATNETGGGDVQKKIMPWRQMSPNEETAAELASQRQKRSDGGLVLVTSLIDKVPNLGGLCRTSEIFGVSEFVIGNLTYLEDRMFQNLSVSAQKWIKITEVLLPRLTEFLEEKRVQGYTLVGVEQTANSVSLQNYQFPKKTLLLLGNEREGIPVDIIQLLDVCVEIPQLGIIRSLNVHVCGALIIWEYTRQHMRGTNCLENGISASSVPKL